MPPTPVPPEKPADVERLAREIHDAVAAEIDELAANLISADDAHLFGDNEFTIRALAHRIPAKAIERHLAPKQNGYHAASVSGPRCGQAAEFHAHRSHTPLSLVGPIRHERAYYLCRRCGEGTFPFGRLKER